MAWLTRTRPELTRMTFDPVPASALPFRDCRKLTRAKRCIGRVTGHHGNGWPGDSRSAPAPETSLEINSQRELDHMETIRTLHSSAHRHELHHR